VTLVATPLRSSAPTQWVSNDGVIRDPRLDEYLRAHQAARGGVALVAPAAALRRVDATLPQGSER
jgi:sigma-E factor negative regulatory protein RseA